MTVTVTVSDTASHTTQWTKVITVTAPPNSGDDIAGTLASPMGIVGIIVVIAVVAVIVAIVSMGRKKRMRGQAPIPPTQQSGPPQNP
jgi:hypothetical protein